ncbi:MAG: tRNA 4-thiouridine(8) synthase ThiI [Candidatus Pacebacteria bacterium]|nr:tRNA 4-thiouridine(8) synthase ThiI [Candidatus Paceibacterota bacterium]
MRFFAIAQNDKTEAFRNSKQRINMLVVCHYGEIALKGDNRKIFEEKLVENIKKSLQVNGIVFDYVKRISGRVIVETQVARILGSKEPGYLENVLKKVFGLIYFAFSQQCDLNIEAIKEKAIGILKDKDFRTFKAEAKRGNKNFALNSQQINEQVGKAVIEKLGKKVDLHNPDVVLFIEITEKYAFLYTEKISGPGGLPAGISGKAISLISGGIDSPVASYLMMKRGVENIFVHFYSNQQGYEQSLEKVRQIIGVLKNYQFSSKVYFVPFSDIQKEILLKTLADLRVVLYRRFMFLVSQEIAAKENAKALITGESVGQVASQTLDNILAIEEAVSLPILRPLAGMDKIEIIDMAKKIGTYEISILPHLDCCSMFVPEHPATKASLKEVQKAEKKLKIKKLIALAIKNSTVEII